MDYTILRQLEPLPYYFFPKQRRFDLPSNPHIDYVNPGIGFATKIYNFYVPLFANNSQHSIKKVDDVEENIITDKTIVDMAKSEDQKGHGLNDENDDNVNESNSIKDNGLPSNSEINQKIKKKLSPGIYDAFMHPKIKTAKLEIVKQPQNKMKKVKQMSHKFHVV